MDTSTTTPPPPDSLSELELDAIQELLNIGVGNAASALSTMVGEEVHLNVPRILLLKNADAERWLGSLGAGELTAVTQLFSGDFDGKALLLFPHAKSMTLVRAILKDELPVDSQAEMERETLLEVGNIVLNACFGTVTNMLKLDVASSVPVLHMRSRSNVVLPPSPSQDYLLIINMHFLIKASELTGYLSFVMDIANLTRFKQRIQQYLRDLSFD